MHIRINRELIDQVLALRVGQMWTDYDSEAAASQRQHHGR